MYFSLTSWSILSLRARLDTPYKHLLTYSLNLLCHNKSHLGLGLGAAAFLPGSITPIPPFKLSSPLSLLFGAEEGRCRRESSDIPPLPMLASVSFSFIVISPHMYIRFLYFLFWTWPLFHVCGTKKGKLLSDYLFVQYALTCSSGFVAMVFLCWKKQ